MGIWLWVEWGGGLGRDGWVVRMVFAVAACLFFGARLVFPLSMVRRDQPCNLIPSPWIPGREVARLKSFRNAVIRRWILHTARRYASFSITRSWDGTVDLVEWMRRSSLTCSLANLLSLTRSFFFISKYQLFNYCMQ